MTLFDHAALSRWEALQRAYLYAPKGLKQARLKALRDFATQQLRNETGRMQRVPAGRAA